MNVSRRVLSRLSTCVALAFALAAPPLLAACTDADIEAVPTGDGGSLRDARVTEDGRVVSAPDAGRSDASVVGNTTDVPDGKVEPNVPVGQEPPAWAAPLLGDYAVRLRIFTREKTSRAAATHEIVSAVQVYFDSALGEVRMRLQMCDDIGDALGGVFKGQLAFPHRYPERLLRVEYAQGEFKTRSMRPDVIGFSEEMRPDCTPGAMVTRGPAQSWLNTGTCVCPSDYKVLPRNPEDCRVTDSDQDSAPGLTVRITSAGLPSKDYVVTRDDSQIVGGTISATRFHAGTYLVNQETVQIECPNGTCTTPEISNCPPAVNTAEFAPLDRLASGEMWQCPALMDAYKTGIAKLSKDPAKFPEAACP